MGVSPAMYYAAGHIITFCTSILNTNVRYFSGQSGQEFLRHAIPSVRFGDKLLGIRVGDKLLGIRVGYKLLGIRVGYKLLGIRVDLLP